MIETMIEIKKLTASDGMILTNGEAYGKEIYLGCNDRADNWYEITEEEYKEVVKMREGNQLLPVQVVRVEEEMMNETEVL